MKEAEIRGGSKNISTKGRGKKTKILYDLPKDEKSNPKRSA